MTYDELVTMLEPTGINVVGPGWPMVALPAITLEPTGLSVFDGYRVMYRECSLAVRYPLGENNVSQFDLMESSVADVLTIIAGTGVQFEPDIEMTADPDASPPAIKAVLSVRFPGGSFCPDPVAEVAEDPDPDPDPDPVDPQE